jgi:tetratricopeptide (TPR) repeat protein
MFNFIVENAKHCYFSHEVPLVVYNWQRELARGKILLTKHDPESALKCFEKALSECPVKESRDLSKILFYLGVTLNKLGMTSCALKSWRASRRFDKNGLSGKLLNRYTNEYGMVKQKSSELDDWKAFYAINLSRYLNTKRSHRIGTDAEGDMIFELIYEAWKELRNSTDLQSVNTEQRLRLFHSAWIVFPTFTAQTDNEDANMIQVDFIKKKKMHVADQCFCGSGLPYWLCCAGTTGKNVFLNG